MKVFVSYLVTQVVVIGPSRVEVGKNVRMGVSVCIAVPDGATVVVL